MYNFSEVEKKAKEFGCDSYLIDINEENNNGLMKANCIDISILLKQFDFLLAVIWNENINARIDYDARIIYLNSGLIDYISKLSEFIACSGVFSSHVKKCRYKNLYNVSEAYSGFIYDSSPYKDKETDELIKLCFRVLILNVVLHELSHSLNNHNKIIELAKKKLSAIDGLNIDDSIIDNAKEVESDKLALDILLKCKGDFEVNFNFESNQLIDFVDKKILFVLILISTYNISREVERSKNNPVKLGESHPPSSSRMLKLISTNINLDDVQSYLLVTMVFEYTKKILHSFDLCSDLSILEKNFSDSYYQWQEDVSKVEALFKILRGQISL
ncbi:hypothetical protein KW513_21395 [Vibrio fluvialis]|nr:hypothetical protein [Vibrio fluvialis]